MVNPPKGSGAEKLQKGAIASVLIGSGIASLFLTPVGGIALGSIGVGILNILHKFYSKFVHKKFRQVIEGENFDMTEQFLVTVVDKSLELGAAKGEEDMERIVEEDLLNKFDKIDQKYKDQIKFEEHLIDDAEGSEEAKMILKNVLDEHGMFSEETLSTAAMRTAGNAVNMVTSPADGVIDRIMAHKTIKGMPLSELRKTIRKAILEANNDPHDYIGPKGIRIRHGNIGGADSDFKKHGGPSRMISKGVWPKMGVDLSNDFDWQFYDCSDGWRYIHTCYAAKNEEGRVVMAIYCKDRMNSANATKTTYDCYVLDCNLIEQNADMQNPNAGWSRWAGQGEYCVNTQQVCDTLEEAYDTYEARWVG